MLLYLTFLIIYFTLGSIIAFAFFAQWKRVARIPKAQNKEDKW